MQMSPLGSGAQFCNGEHLSPEESADSSLTPSCARKPGLGSRPTGGFKRNPQPQLEGGLEQLGSLPHALQTTPRGDVSLAQGSPLLPCQPQPLPLALPVGSCFVAPGLPGPGPLPSCRPRSPLHWGWWSWGSFRQLRPSRCQAISRHGAPWGRWAASLPGRPSWGRWARGRAAGAFGAAWRWWGASSWPASSGDHKGSDGGRWPEEGPVQQKAEPRGHLDRWSPPR